MLSNLPFYSITNHELDILFQTSKSKLTDLLNNHNLQSYLDQSINAIENNTYYTTDNLNEINEVSKTDLSVFHLNIRSLNKHADELINFLSEIQVNFDCICLTEINRVNLNLYHSLLPGYVFHPVPPQQGNIGGVGLYVKQHIKLDELNALQLNCSDPCENLWVQMTKGNKDTILGIIYRHPNGNISSFNDELEKTLQTVQTLKHDKCIITGDINIDLIKYDLPGRAKTKEYLDLMLTHGYLPGNILPSRVTDHTATLIDHTFIKERHQSDRLISGNIFTDISDHFSTFLLTFQSSIRRSLEHTRKARIFGPRNTAKFVTLMQNTNWESLYEENDTNKCTQIFHDSILKAYNDAFPTKVASNKRLKDKPWVCSSLKKCISKKNKLYCKFLKKRTPENKKKYSTYRNILSSCLQQCKNEYFKELFNNKSTRITKMWSVLGTMLNPKKQRVDNSIRSINFESKTYHDDLGITNSLNKHFCSIGNKIANKIPKPLCEFTSFLRNHVQETFFSQMVEENEVLKQIQALKIKKSPGHDDIKPSIIKASYSFLVKPLTYIYNLSFYSGVVPDIWKIAKVIPIFKSGDRSDTNNYRPISLLSCFEKIMERLLAKRILSFVRKHKILYRLQFGFREGHSTTHALLEPLEKIYTNLDDGKFCVGIFLDLSKAFDTIDHSILLTKLKHYGFRGKICEWFASYLSNRKQYTFANGTSSSYGLIQKGVPQGSVLGPILFTLYVNDMPNATTLEPRLLADDTNIFNFGDNLQNLSQQTNLELEKLNEWLKANKLKINTGKTNFCLFNPNNKSEAQGTLTIKMGDTLKQSEEIKYLGIKLDSKLTWKNHVEKIKLETIKFASIFYKLRYIVPKQCLTVLYSSMVLSKIAYSLETYGLAAKKYLNELQTLQNRILRILYFKDRKYPTNALHKELNFPKINDLYELKILKFMHNLYHNDKSVPDVFQNYFRLNESRHNYATRQSKHYEIPKTRRKWGEKMLLTKGARLWNDLPINLKNITHVKAFAKHVKQNIINKY